MKSILLTLLLSALGLAAQDRYVTVTVPAEFELNLNGLRQSKPATNSLEIATGETAHLLSSIAGVDSSGYGPTVYVQKNGVVAKVEGYFISSPNSSSYAYKPADLLVVNGPAKLLVAAWGGGMATFKITPDQYPPDRTVVVPGGPGGATVTMECSTNLVHWEPAVGGTYTNLPGVKFFRIKLDRIQP